MRKPIEVGYKELEEQFPGFGDSALLPFEIPPKYGQMSLLETAILSRIISVLNPKLIFEFGRCDGNTTAIMALAAPESFIATLDLPVALDIYATSNSENAIKRWEKFGVINQIGQIFQNSKDFEPENCNIEAFDVVLVDAGHELDEVTNDCEKGIEMLKVGGILFVHDFGKRNFPAVTSFVASKAKEWDFKWINSRQDYLETSLCYCIKK